MSGKPPSSRIPVTMSGKPSPSRPVTCEDIFQDYEHRRLGVIKALTNDFEDFFKLCDPDIAADLCLYGLPDGGWRVSSQSGELPSELPEPTSGINFVRDTIPKEDWVAAVALRSDVWLLAVTLFVGSKIELDRDDRRILFNKINELPTILEVVCGTRNVKTSGNRNTNTRSKTNSRAGQSESQGKNSDGMVQSKKNLCGLCNKGESQVKWFWIYCDVCEIWFHGKCVGITLAQSKKIDLYKCPSCSSPKSTKRRASPNQEFIYY